MPPRTLLRTQLSKAWQKTIKSQYKEQLINSERGLQIYFCSALLGIFQKNNRTENNKRRIFVEPRLSIGEDIRYPDLVVCDKKLIIGVVELKYLPRGLLNFEKHVKKDIKTLELIANYQQTIEISNDRFLGPADDGTPYSLAKDAVLCWGGVYRGNEEKDISEHTANLSRRFLGLHAVTSKQLAPIIFSSNGI